MAKKNFANIPTGDIYAAQIAEATGQNIGYAPEEHPALSGKPAGTQGRAGQKLPRINMAFSPEVYSYIKTISKVRGETITAYVNSVLLADMQKNAAEYEQLLRWQEQFAGGKK